ncbi:MAG: MAPEG family protein [Pikeienuella sp.]
MTPELTALALAGLLQGAQFFIYAVPATLSAGPAWALGPRDEPLAPGVMSPRTARLGRALDNHAHALALFAAAVAVVVLAGEATAFTAVCAWVYLAARVVYVPAYACGWVPWRSVAFGVGTAATMLMFIASLV